VNGEGEIAWRGWGRWLSFLTAALLILIAIPGVFINSLGAAAGWNIFLGLLLFGSIASDNKRAPLLAAILAGLMALRLLIAIALGARLPDLSIAGLLLVLTAGIAFDLRRQARRRSGPVHPHV